MQQLGRRTFYAGAKEAGSHERLQRDKRLLADRHTDYAAIAASTFSFPLHDRSRTLKFLKIAAVRRLDSHSISFMNSGAL
jgi:hypothetical protein